MEYQGVSIFPNIFFFASLCSFSVNLRIMAMFLSIQVISPEWFELLMHFIYQIEAESFIYYIHLSFVKIHF